VPRRKEEQEKKKEKRKRKRKRKEKKRKEKRKKVGGSGESKVPTTITRSSITLLNIQGLSMSGVSGASRKFRVRRVGGSNSDLPFYFSIFF
jgi:hypothetical protein